MGGGVLAQFKDLGVAAVLAFAAMGSALGSGAAGMAAVGAWKKAFAQNKAASFMLVAFVGAPLTQTIYGMIVMNKLAEAAAKGSYMWSVGILCGIAMGLSALMQGRAGAPGVVSGRASLRDGASKPPLFSHVRSAGEKAALPMYSPARAGTARTERNRAVGRRRIGLNGCMVILEELHETFGFLWTGPAAGTPR